jgi:hypothetical protein
MQEMPGQVNRDSQKTRVLLESVRIEWPDHIADPDGDRERALDRAYRSVRFRRIAWLFTAAVVAALLLLYSMGVL